MTLLDPVLGAFAAVPAIEWVAAGLALGYLGFAIRQNAWCWAFAVASALLYLVVFARAGLVMQAALQVFYVGMSVYGWRSWRGSASAVPVAVGRWTLRQHAAAWAAHVITRSSVPPGSSRFGREAGTLSPCVSEDRIGGPICLSLRPAEDS